MGKRVIFAIYAALCLAGAGNLEAQRNRLQGRVETGKQVTLAGQVHAYATAENDQGPAEDALMLPNLTMVLKPTAQQQADLEAFLARQQDPASPDFHHWLTPEEYGYRFGVSQADIDRITAWLAGRNLKVISVPPSRNSIVFTGGVRDVEKAFGTEIHRYTVKGVKHFANATAPRLPATLDGMVTAIHGLHDFRPQARKARYTSAVDGTTHYLTPDDIAAIYDVSPLLNAGTDGTGQKIAIVGQTQVNINDIREFRNAYNLPAVDPQLLLVPGLPDPGISTADLGEADLDIEWAGAVARKATIVFVYSQDVTDALQYAITQNLAPVISMSYGLCESLTGTAELNSLRTFAQQANAQGITWVAASGDSGGADCYDPSSRGAAQIAVDAPASVPEVTGVGGLEFNEGSGNWWNATNSSSLASATGYIPEMVWNDSVADNTPASGGGGVSTFFSKPTWQTGPGVPNDSARDVPDVSFAASADHDGYLYFSGGIRSVVGGTSVATPVFAGMLALLNQYQVANGFQATPGLSNINPQLYAMAQSSPGAFHDVTTGSNSVNPCPTRNRSCGAANVGYSAGPGYDLASGLGSLDAFNFVTAWHLKTTLKAATVTVTSSTQSLAASGSLVLTATLSGTSGTPTGAVNWSVAGMQLGSGAITVSGTKATASLTVPASKLAVGTVIISAAYGGDSAFSPAAGNITISVLPAQTLTISGATNAASFKQGFAPGTIVSVFGTAMAAAAQSAPLVPLPTQLSGTAVTINGYLSPLYYISPTQINVQIPYYISPGPATLKVSYGGQSASINFTVTAAAPGIFVDPANGATIPNESAKRGDVITLYITGEGAVTPSPNPGDVPAGANTRPTQSVSVSVGGVAVPAAGLTYVGVPGWAIGATQINYTVPATAPLGKQPVIVTVGGVASAPATINITQ